MKTPFSLILTAVCLAIAGAAEPSWAQAAPAPAEVATQPYRVTLRSASAPHQVATPDDRRKNWFVEPGMTFGGADGKRFLVKTFVRKTVPDPRVGEKDVSEMAILDQSTGKEHVLVMGVEKDIGK
jgi:hypothetical protein